MSLFFLSRSFPVFLLIVLFQPRAYAQTSQAGPLGKAEELAREHTEKVLEEAPQFIEGYGREVADQAIQDAQGGAVAGVEGPIDHPWKDGNPASYEQYEADSQQMLDAWNDNSQNWSQAWSCFEPKLLAKAENGLSRVDYEGPDNADLIDECRQKCPHHASDAQGLGFVDAEKPLEIAKAKSIYHGQMGCSGDSDPFGYYENGYEIVEFWYPEYQVEINNFGINRIRPDELSGTGRMFTRRGLIQAKQQADQKIRQELQGQQYGLDIGQYQDPDYPDQRLKGQGAWGGYASPDFQDKSYGHVVRTWLSIAENEKKIETKDGWQIDPERSLYDALPARKEDKDPVVLWTEHGLANAITSIPHLSYQIRPQVMQALFGAESSYMEKAKTPFYQSQGATAYRVGKWGSIYEPLKRLEISGANNSALKEVVYKNGYELFPLVTNQSGFTAPALSTAAIFARRVLYLAGARSPVEQGGDASGMVRDIFPQGEEMGRMITYTINIEDKSREIDKLQLLSPKRPKDGSRTGGKPPMLSECFRSQNIPNYISDDKSLQEWVDRNMPRKLVGYHSDMDDKSDQGGAISFTYWNRRIGCFCDRCGIPTGSSTIEDGGDGDKLYDKPREEYCRYPIKPQMVSWSAWSKKETFQECQQNGKNDSFYDGRGLEDEV